MVHQPPLSPSHSPPSSCHSPRRTFRLIDRRCSAISSPLISSFIPNKRSSRSSIPQTLPLSPSSSSRSPSSSIRLPMLRTVRERFRFRRPRRHDGPAPQVFTPPAQPTSVHESQPILQAPNASPAPNYSNGPEFSDPVAHSDVNGTVDKHYSTGSPSDSQADDSSRQPRVFRNRSLEYGHRRDRQFLGMLAEKAMRTFNRSRPSPDRSRSPRDRPLVSPLDEPQPHPAEQPQNRNDDSFSSLPSTHASRDPFLNDDVPVDISRLDTREDRSRPSGHCASDSFPRPLDNRPHGEDSPKSVASNTTSRKRSSLWKRKYDPHNEFQAPHEREILKAIALSEASVKEHNVHAAQQLNVIIEDQVSELDEVLADIDKRVDCARIVADKLPSIRDPRFEPYLRIRGSSDEDESASVNNEIEQSNGGIPWTERVWDIEELIAEKQFEDAVASIEKLQKDNIESFASPRIFSKFQSLILQLVSEMSSCCTQGGADSAAVFAPLLGRLGMADHARQVVLDSAQSELTVELRYIVADRQDVTPRCVNMILDKTLSIFRYTYDVYMKITSSQSTNASSFVAWIVEQSDQVYAEFVSPALGRMKKADPVTILATIEAIRHRRLYKQSPVVKDVKSLISLLETRMATHIRKELDGPIRDAERQLMERARMYASAVPRNWKDGPYQSGKAVCDELNVLSRGLEGSLMNLGAEADVLTGNLLVRPALMYCTTLLEMGVKAVTEDESLNQFEMQQGVFATFVIVGKTLSRLHQKFTTIPMLERVGNVLTSANLGEVRILQAEVFARRNSTRVQTRRSTSGVLSRTLKV